MSADSAAAPAGPAPPLRFQFPLSLSIIKPTIVSGIKAMTLGTCARFVFALVAGLAFKKSQTMEIVVIRAIREGLRSGTNMAFFIVVYKLSRALWRWLFQSAGRAPSALAGGTAAYLVLGAPSTSHSELALHALKFVAEALINQLLGGSGNVGGILSAHYSHQLVSSRVSPRGLYQLLYFVVLGGAFQLFEANPASMKPALVRIMHFLFHDPQNTAAAVAEAV
eukprot:TRINITY_DN20361_c0_g1_i1.p1 TRINITY_DN20361_c0_g1~~TRINITY_DN20361_c0_g1_i1.p1  ORF type:complete len:242 (-),score=54.16 TRINITY_DN20361_c0_g1_i1:13-681(-)